MHGTDPPGLQVHKVMGPLDVLLELPAMGRGHIPAGADTTMTTTGPDQAWFIVVAVTCTIVPAFFLALRMYTKLVIVKSLELADYFLLLAFPLLIAEVGMGAHMVKWGAGVHQWQVTLNQIFHQLYWANVAQVIYCPLSFLVKMAILLQYLRLFAPNRSVNKVMWFGAWLTIAATFIIYTIFMFWTLFYCSPRPMIWFKLTPGGHCHNVVNIILSQGAFNMVSDIIVLLLPTSSLWQLRVPRAKKVFITMLFGTGLLACVASAMRIVCTISIDKSMYSADVSHDALFIGLWTEAEVSLGFIVACSLSLPKLIQAKAPRFKKSLSKASAQFSYFSSGSRPSLPIDSNGVYYMAQIDEEQAVVLEDREAHRRQALARLQPVQMVRDAYALPSPVRSSEYSRYSQGNTFSYIGEEYGHIEAVIIAQPEILRSVSVHSEEVPVRWDPMGASSYMPVEGLRLLPEFNFEAFHVSFEEETWPRRL